MSEEKKIYKDVHNYTKYKLVEMLIKRLQDDRLNLDNLNAIEDVADDVLKVEAKKDAKTKKCNLRLKNLVSVASIKSKMENGLLTLTLPKKEVAESVNIEIE